MISEPIDNIITVSIIVAVVFIVLKLFGQLAWSWIWVMSPLWTCAIFVILGLVFLVLFLK